MSEKVEKIKGDIKKIEASIKVYSKKNDATSKKIIQSFKSKLDVFEKELQKAEKEEQSALKKIKIRATSKKVADLKKLISSKKYAIYKNSDVDLEKDAARPALPIGKRKSKITGNTYYEYRANRIDVKQPAKRYPKLEHGGYMAKGGEVENLEKELRKLQRELNSGRLSTYKQGDKSEEEMNRQKERAEKMARFYEVLKLYREKDNKMAKGGGIDGQKIAKPSGWRWKNSAVTDGIISESSLYKTPSERMRKMYPDYVDFENRPTKSDKNPSKKYISLETGGQMEDIEIGDLVVVKKYGWIMRVEDINDGFYYLENDSRGSMNGNAGGYLIQDIDKVSDGGYMAHGGEVLSSFSIDEMKKYLDEKFEYSFGFKVYPIKKGTTFLPDYDSEIIKGRVLKGLSDSDLKGKKLSFPNYKINHEINFKVSQGEENTYFEFLLMVDNSNYYSGTFGFKDQGDVSSDYITRFIAFLMQQYGLPFQIEHNVFEHGGYMAHGGDLEKRVDTLYSTYGFINDDYNWRLKLLEMLQNPSYEAYEIYQSLNEEQKGQVLQELYEMDNDMGSYGDGDIETSKENLEIILDDSKNAKPKLEHGGYMADGGELKEFNLREVKGLSKNNEKILTDDNGNDYVYENGVLYDLEIIDKNPYYKKGTSYRMSKIKVNILEHGGYMAHGGEIKYEVDDVVYNKVQNTVGIVRMAEERGEVKTDADGNVDVDDLEYYNPIKHKAHGLADIAPSTKKEIEERGLWKPFSKHTSKMAYGGGIEDIDMNKVESSALFYTDESKWTPKPTIKKFADEIAEMEKLKKMLDNKEITPSKIIGTGYKSQYVRPLAYRWLNEQILIAKRAIEILQERGHTYANGGELHRLQQ
jgi:hypothetical protein